MRETTWFLVQRKSGGQEQGTEEGGWGVRGGTEVLKQSEKKIVKSFCFLGVSRVYMIVMGQGRNR